MMVKQTSERRIRFRASLTAPARRSATPVTSEPSRNYLHGALPTSRCGQAMRPAATAPVVSGTSHVPSDLRYLCVADDNSRPAGVPMDVSGVVLGQETARQTRRRKASAKQREAGLGHEVQ